jgi:hypothetical protein
MGFACSRVPAFGLALGLSLSGCGGQSSELDGLGAGGGHSDGPSGSGGTAPAGGSGGAFGSGGQVASGGATSSGGDGTGGTGDSGGTGGDSQNLGGASPSEIDPDDLGQPCENGSCPTDLTPIVYELCGSASCVTFCECHLPCEETPEICPEGSSCQVVFGIEGQQCALQEP